MPQYQAIVDAANKLLNRDSVDLLAVTLQTPLAGDSALITLARAIGLSLAADQERFLSAWPPSIQTAIQGAVYGALDRPERMPVTFAWAPGADFQATIWEVAGTTASRGGVTILLNSPYPTAPTAT